MDENRHSGISRRRFVQRGMGSLAGIAIVSLVGTRPWAADQKLPKTAVQYEEHAKKEGTDCDDCIQFIPGKTTTGLGTCKIVEGEINPHGHCIAFTPRRRK